MMSEMNFLNNLLKFPKDQINDETVELLEVSINGCIGGQLLISLILFFAYLRYHVICAWPRSECLFLFRAAVLRFE